MDNRQNPVLYIVIPCYNEQEVLPITAPLFLQKITQLAGRARSARTAGSCSSTTGPKTGPGRSSRNWHLPTRTMLASARAATAATRMPCWQG